ncbi:MAG: hydroxymethylpyrimidine/phosphomethylpyrimidine kinase [Gammaproteobacteria bacterium]|nr:hydroxymethylpyrimidine/phosphomethylpyrimidine kinase [Gammaproteobacteria bacterium]
MKKTAYPIILSISGHDPTGGAGIQADIETAAAIGCRATNVITCLTVQDSCNVRQLIPVEAGLIDEQIRTLLADIPVKVIKTGLLGDLATAKVLTRLLDDHPNIPVVVDPVLTAGGGTELADAELTAWIARQLLPRATLATPNSLEARRLAGASSLDDCAEILVDTGCGAILITGTHEPGGEVTNSLYLREHSPVRSSWPRLEGSYHGSGCTLASSIAAFLALGRSLRESVVHGQKFTWQALAAGYRPGQGQFLPDRFSTRKTHRAR